MCPLEGWLKRTALGCKAAEPAERGKGSHRLDNPLMTVFCQCAAQPSFLACSTIRTGLTKLAGSLVAGGLSLACAGTQDTFSQRISPLIFLPGPIAKAVALEAG